MEVMILGNTLIRKVRYIDIANGVTVSMYGVAIDYKGDTRLYEVNPDPIFEYASFLQKHYPAENAETIIRDYLANAYCEKRNFSILDSGVYKVIPDEEDLLEDGAAGVMYDMVYGLPDELRADQTDFSNTVIAKVVLGHKHPVEIRIWFTLVVDTKDLKEDWDGTIIAAHEAIHSALLDYLDRFNLNSSKKLLGYINNIRRKYGKKPTTKTYDASSVYIFQD